MNGLNLNKEDITEIRKAAAFVKFWYRLKYGIISLKNPVKAIIVIAYIISVIKIWDMRKKIIKYIFNSDRDIITQILECVFSILIILLALIIFIGIINIFGSKIKSKKLELACISSGIYTRAKKAPFLIWKYKDKNTPVVKIWEIYLNGNTLEDFEKNLKKLESELGVKIHKLKPKGTRKILMYITSDKIRHKNNMPSDPDFGG